MSSSLQRFFCQSSAESISLSGPGLHFSVAAGTWIFHRQTVQGGTCTRDWAWLPVASEPYCPLCVSVGEDHEWRGSQLVSRSSFPSPQHPKHTLMLLFWKNLTAQTSWMSWWSWEILNPDQKPRWIRMPAALSAIYRAQISSSNHGVLDAFRVRRWLRTHFKQLTQSKSSSVSSHTWSFNFFTVKVFLCDVILKTPDIRSQALTYLQHHGLLTNQNIQRWQPLDLPIFFHM